MFRGIDFSVLCMIQKEEVARAHGESCLTQMVNPVLIVMTLTMTVGRYYFSMTIVPAFFI